MNLSIAEVANAVGRSEGYVRQHVHRKHLTVRRSGRSVFVALAEAIRWAGERGLTFLSPGRVSVTADARDCRTARMTVLVLSQPGDHPRNLLTLIRHRRDDRMGPWAAKTNRAWSVEDFGDRLRMLSLDAPLEQCRELVDGILETGILEIEGLELHYALEPTPVRHWAYRDKRGSADDSVISPFQMHSAEVTEYWSLSADPRQWWIEWIGSSHPNLTQRLKRLGFPLDRRSDRVGNLMIIGAADTLECDLKAGHNRTLVFRVGDRNRFLSGAYRAVVWASHCGNQVLREEIRVEKEETVIPLSFDIDHVGFAVFRAVDGHCVDRMEVFLWVSKDQLSLHTAVTKHIRDHRGRSVYSYSWPMSRSTTDIGVEGDEMAEEIRRLWLDRRLQEQRASPVDTVRFEADEVDQAVDYLVGLLHQAPGHPAPIYLADPWFLHWFMNKSRSQHRLNHRIFAATVGRPWLILCTEPRQDDNAQAWRTKFPDDHTKDVQIRMFRTQDRERGFHDRFLITPDREVIITNSINGWRKHGVTFSSLPRGLDIYRAQTEELWSMARDSKNTPLFVQDIS